MKVAKNFEDCTPDQKIERWENVLRVLKGLSPHERRRHWNMATWGMKAECGTIACAAGHCGLDPWFRRRGFQLNFERDVFGCISPDMPTDATEFFGYEGCEEIFHDPTHRSVTVVIREVRDYIKKLRDV